MTIIETEADIAEGLAALRRLDPRLGPVIAYAGQVPLRRSEAGFRSLARTVVSQQLSVASARAIWDRLDALVDWDDPHCFLDVKEATLKACGLSAPKQRSLAAIASALRNGELKLDDLHLKTPDEVRDHMMSVKGIGPWTAEIYLLFAIGHRDVFPVGDLALRQSVATELSFSAVPDMKELEGIVAQWSPWRGVAARVFWACYGKRKGRKTEPDI
jgi:DNA-3-methyladenine glycosylase II